MSKAHDLPFEICQKIFEHLSDPFSSKDLINCAVTCHSWFEAAKQMLYKKVNLDGSQVSKLRKSLNQHQQPLIEKGQFVTELGIGYNSDIEDFGDEDSDDDDSEDEDLSSEFTQEEFHHLRFLFGHDIFCPV